jgi:hypothetical protein
MFPLPLTVSAPQLTRPLLSIRPRNLPVGEALAFDAAQYLLSAVSVIHTKSDACIVSEIELGKVAVEMLFLAVLVGAAHAALEHGEIALDRVCVDHGSPFWVLGILALAVVNAIMAGEAAEPILVELGSIGHHRRLFGDIGLDDGDYLGRGASGDVIAAHAAAAFD